MIVTIPATKEHNGMSLVTLEIGDYCPVCERERGRIFGVHSYDGSRRLNCDGWENRCGHIDTYEAVRLEGVPVPFKEPAPFGQFEDELAEREPGSPYWTAWKSGQRAVFDDTRSPLERLLDSLEKYTLEERFFDQFKHSFNGENVFENHCPTRESNGVHRFFGNFEEFSHAFLLETTDPAVFEPLSLAIKANKGWALYYEKNLSPEARAELLNSRLLAAQASEEEPEYNNRTAELEERLSDDLESRLNTDRF